MKKLIVLFALIATNVAGQSHQSDILKFVDDNKGVKIGGGLCYELVQGAIQSFDPQYDLRSTMDKGVGKKVKRSDVQPGDIVIMSGGTKRVANHIAIVYSVSGEDIFVAEQNTKGSLKKSIVIVDRLDFEYHEEYYGKIKYSFYRPL